MSDSGLIPLASAAVKMVKEDDIHGGDSEENSTRLPQQVPLKKRKVWVEGNPLTNLGGRDFTPHIFIVNPSEDIIGKIMTFTKNGSRGVCVLAANGVVSNVKVQQLGLNGSVVNFEGAYELISLRNSMVISESGGVRNETGGWRISIGGINGSCFGGCLVGKLIAATPVQVVLGSFWPLIANSSQEKNEEFKSVVATPTIPAPSACASTGSVQEPEMRDPSHFLSLGLQTKSNQ